MDIVSKKGFIYLFILMVFSYFLFPSLGFCLSSSIEDENFGESLFEETESSLLLAKAKKKKQSKKKKSKKDKKNKKDKKGKKSKEDKDFSKVKNNNSYWGIGGGYVYNMSTTGMIFAEMRKDLFTNFFVYLQGTYTLGVGEYFSLYGGGLGMLYSYRMSDLIEIAGGGAFIVNLLSLVDESKISNVFVDTSTNVSSTTLMYVAPKLSVALHFTPLVAISLEATVLINVAVGEEVVDKVHEYIGTFFLGAGTMVTF